MTPSYELPLKSFWKSQGAVFGKINGFEVPLRFRNTQEEYETVSEKTGILDFSFKGKIKITGADRISLLHRLLTNHIEKLIPGQGCPAAFLTAPGKILMLMHVFVFEDFVLLQVDEGCAPRTIERLNQFIIAEDVQLEDITQSYGLLGLEGPEAAALLETLFAVPLQPLKPYDHRSLLWEGHPATFLKLSFTGKTGFQILFPSAITGDLTSAILKDKRFEVKPAGWEAAEILRIKAGILRMGTDIDENINLCESGLDTQLADGTKGCYPGQEAVARTQTYGGLHRKIVRLKLKTAVLPLLHSPILSEDGKTAGKMLSAVLLTEKKEGLALALLEKEFWEVKNLIVLSDSKKIPAERL